MEFRSIDLVEKAIALSGTVVMGLPIVVQLTESERNRLHPGDGSGHCSFIVSGLHYIPGISTYHPVLTPPTGQCSGSLSLVKCMQVFLTSFYRLYVGSLHFNLTESDIKQVFEPFGELEFVDLHRDPMTGRSKGYAFVQ